MYNILKKFVDRKKSYMVSFIIRKGCDMFSVGEQMFSNMNELYLYTEDMRSKGLNIEIVRIIPETKINTEKIGA